MISIHAPHAGRDPDVTIPVATGGISIHAPHAGRDCGIGSGGCPDPYFNPRAPCGARLDPSQRSAAKVEFQSTRPMRGATQLAPFHGAVGVPFQSTRPMRGATDPAVCPRWAAYISIHAPHAGRDSFFRNLLSFNLRFQSTRPMRGATYTIGGQWRSIQISIHAPHAGRDCRTSHEFPQAEPYFNPRAPCGARRILNSMFDHPQGFQSTRPMRGATIAATVATPTIIFQSTRPMRGATPFTVCCCQRACLFQSTRPVRGATTIITEVEDLPLNFNPRAPCGARPAAGAAAIGPLTDFNPRVPCGARLPGRLGRGPEKGFQSTRPVRGATRPRKRALPCLKFQSTRPVRGATGIIPSKEVIAMTISIHAPRAGRDRLRQPGWREAAISIHAPRAGRDASSTTSVPDFWAFQSTRPVRGATTQRGAGDHGNGDFNPRAPCGARPVPDLWHRVDDLFQSTRPVRGAT